MQYEDLESWQLEELADRVHSMVGFFSRLQKRMDKEGFQPLVFGDESSDGKLDTELGVVDWDQLEAERPLLFP